MRSTTIIVIIAIIVTIIAIITTIMRSTTTTTIFKCNGEGLGKSCNETNPAQFVKGSTQRCKACHASYQRRWHRAKKLGVKVSRVRVIGKGRSAKVIILRSGDPSDAEVDVKEEMEDDETEEEEPKKKYDREELEAKYANLKKRYRAKDALAKALAKDLDEANGNIEDLEASLERLTIAVKSAKTLLGNALIDL